MQIADWRVVRDVFERALDVPLAGRVAFVADETRGREDLRTAVLRLLERESQGDLLSPPRGAGPLRGWPGRGPGSGDRLGGYALVRVLGAGGMGTVYEARQERPDRAVAVKVIHAWARGPEALRRFQIEAEVLGRLRHPGIAAIYEMGVHRAPDGSELPFFAMEYVEGARDLVTHARESRLDLADRIALFSEVCEAVNYAHQKGVIHRDLKPTNVLVDAAGRPKVIDYGIARVVAADGAREDLTGLEHLPGTLQYMSPEQLTGPSQDLDTRSDIYALGVILYQLLTGSLPHEVAGRPIAQFVAEVCTLPPAPPSQRAPGLSHELDWIALKALSLERERRYGSAAELALDLARFLRREPVAAGPPTRRYRLAKFASRNRALVIAAGLLAASLVGGLVTTTLARLEAEQRRVEAVSASQLADERAAEAEAARSAATAEAERARVALARQQALLGALTAIFTSVQPTEDGRHVTLVELLERERPRLEGEFAGDPELRAEIQSFLGSAYDALGLDQESEELLVGSIAALETVPTADPQELAWLRLMLANKRVRQSRFGEARELFDASLPVIAPAGQPGDQRGITALRSYAVMLAQVGATAEAAQALAEAWSLSVEVLGADATETLQAASQFAKQLFGLRRWDEAERTAREAHARALAVHGAEHPVALFTGMVLGEGLHARGEHAEAGELLAAVLEQAESLFGERHRNTIHAHQVLATVRAALGRVDEAEGLARRALELCLEHHPEQIDGEIRARMCLAGVLAAGGNDEGRCAELEAARQRLGGDTRHPAWWALSWTLAETELAAGRAEEAAAGARELIAVDEAAVPVEDRKLAMAHGLLGRALWATGLSDAAGPELAACYEVTSRWTDLELAVLSDESLDSLIEVSRLLGQAEELERLRRLRTEGLPR